MGCYMAGGGSARDACTTNSAEVSEQFMFPSLARSIFTAATTMTEFVRFALRLCADKSLAAQAMSYEGTGLR